MSDTVDFPNSIADRDARHERALAMHDRMDASEMDATATYQPFYDPWRYNPAYVELAEARTNVTMGLNLH